MAKVYVLTQGSYSDYQIVGVALDPEKAEQLRVIKSTFSDPCYIEEFDTEEIEVAKDFEPFWFVPFDVDNVKEDDIFSFTGNAPYKTEEWGHEQYNVIVKAKDKDHAIKVAIDTLAQYKAIKAEIALGYKKLNEFGKDGD